MYLERDKFAFKKSIQINGQYTDILLNICPFNDKMQPKERDIFIWISLLSLMELS